MSVIGLTFSLTQWLTRARSRHAVCDNTISRGCEAPRGHSLGLSAQNSTQPIGARVTSPMLAYKTRPSLACADAVIPNRRVAIASALSCPLNQYIVAPVSWWDHVSHKDFSPPLSAASRFETN